MSDSDTAKKCGRQRIDEAIRAANRTPHRYFSPQTSQEQLIEDMASDPPRIEDEEDRPSI